EASQATEGQQAWEQAGQATTVHPMTYDAANLHYAMEMLECLVWDPAVPRIPRYSLCCVPMGYKCSGRDMLEIIGRIMESAGSRIRTLVMDNHSTHGLLKSFLKGFPENLTAREIAALPFWRHVTFEDLPESPLPRFPYRRPMLRGEALLALNGPKHIVKNLVCGLRSACRTVHVGRYFTDWCGGLDLHLPPGAFQGFDAQSDMEASTMLNPYHLILQLCSTVAE
ncbi:unnamed protein product, partial [Symbiodinium microadriaticum]